MSKRIGETLILKGYLSEGQLKKALDAQLILGGHLGTCLIELGFIDEALLGRLLAEAKKVTYAAPRALEDIPGHVIGVLPSRIVEKYQAIPFGLKDKVLQVAMIDPKNLVALDELAFASGYTIEPAIAPEVRIVQAMERYYEIPRKLRYIALLDSSEADPGEGGTDEPGEPGAAAGLVTAAGEPWERTRTTGTVPVTEGRVEPGQEAPGDLDQVSEHFCKADNRERLGEVALNHSSQFLARCILFAVNDGTASIWGSRGIPLDFDEVTRPTFSVTSEPIFRLLLGKPEYRGPVYDDARYRGFYDALQMELPSEVLILPVGLANRSVALLYGDAGSGAKIEGDTQELHRLAQKLGLALNLIIVKGKIRAA